MSMMQRERSREFISDVGWKMRRRSGRRDRRRFHHGRVGPGIRRYLLCLRNDASDTDSDSIPLSSLLDEADNDTEAVNYSTALLTQINSDVGTINPAVYSGLMQMYSATDSAVDPLADTRQLIVHRMSTVHSAMPLFADHLQLPLFTGQRRWHTMFGQLNQLSSSGSADMAALNADEDILADSNFASLFDSSPDRDYHRVEPVNEDNACEYHDSTDSCMPMEASPQLSAVDVTATDFPALDENADSVQQFLQNANMDQSDHATNSGSAPASVTDLGSSSDVAHNLLTLNRQSANDYARPAHEYAGRHVGTLLAGSQARTLHGRRHSDPGSIHSGTTGSLSSTSNSENWYYYDHRLGPGGALAAQYGRLRTRQSLSVIVSPPSYDDVVYSAPVLPTVDQDTTNTLPPQSQTATCENVTDLPPPYQQSERPPSYSEVPDVNEQLGDVLSPMSSRYDECSQQSCSQNWQTGGDNAVLSRCSNSRGMFVGRPAVRWNRNTRVEQWGRTSSFNWVMS